MTGKIRDNYKGAFNLKGGVDTNYLDNTMLKKFDFAVYCALKVSLGILIYELK